MSSEKGEGRDEAGWENCRGNGVTVGSIAEEVVGGKLEMGPTGEGAPLHTEGFRNAEACYRF